MNLVEDNRKDIVAYRKVDREEGKLLSHLLTMRLKGDYSDRFGLTGADVLPYIEPTEAFIKKIAELAELSLTVKR